MVSSSRARVCGRAQMTVAGEVYVGEWWDDKRHGRGRVTLGDGGTYVGTFARGVYDGIGIFRSKDGDEYDGEW